jgi:hypothetical protein
MRHFPWGQYCLMHLGFRGMLRGRRCEYRFDLIHC